MLVNNMTDNYLNVTQVIHFKALLLFCCNLRKQKISSIFTNSVYILEHLPELNGFHANRFEI